jgi:proline iminopeptidase
MPASSKLWRKEEQILAQRMSKKDSLKQQAIRNSALYEENKPEAIEQLLILSFRNQFYDSTLADRLEFYIPDDYMSRSQQFGNIMVDIAEYDLHDTLSSVEVPTLLIYGEDEPATTLSGEKLDAAIPNSKFTVIKESGHFPFIEKPDQFFSELRSFLKTQS